VASGAADLDLAASDVVSPEAVRRRRLQLGTVGLLVVALDQITKAWAVSALADKDIEGPWGSSLRLVYNTGSAFSFGSGFGPVFGVIALGVAVWLFRFVREVEDFWLIVGLGMIQGGAVGNVLDRLFRDGDGFMRGAVVDFIEAADWWPVFNVADIAIVVGGFVVVILGSRA
jgi:signal peptidase II